MKGIFALILWAILPKWTAQAEPVVIGVERFHGGAPSAAGGRLLYNELGCGNCHGRVSGLPVRRGPELAGVTQRIDVEWLRAFLVSPSTARPGTNMPHLLSAEKPEEVEAVLHYLASLKPKSGDKLPSLRHVNVESGKELFHTIGCVACHAPGQDYRPAEGAPKAEEFTHRSVEFPQLGKKYVLASLAAFLRDPLKVRIDGRMPRIEMTEQDAIDIAGYLMSFEGSDGQTAPKLEGMKVDKLQVARGQELVSAARCSACHELPGVVAPQPIQLHQFAGGCLESSDVPGIAAYHLSPSQKSALKLFLTEREQAGPENQLAELSLEALNCLACHDRAGRGGPDLARKSYFQGDHNLGDTGRYPPPLTEVGRKLQPEWFAKVLEGGARVRPYLQTRMPNYGPATVGLVERFGKVDAKAEGKWIAGNEDTAGRKLMGTQGGLGCITCHRWGTRASLGIQALDLSNLGQRLQPGWLSEYLIDPAGHRPGTLMPSFWPGGIAANTEILGGETKRQIGAIYSFVKSANGEPEGFPSTAGGEFELIPKDYPIVQRTFMEGVGSQAILVGFPQGVHLAYDGKNGRPALAWKGKFFDAYSTWFSRFAPFEKPLGESVVKWPTTGATEVQFGGYRLDAQRVPTFLLRVNGVQILERFEPIDGGLRRTLSGDGSVLKNLVIQHPDGVVMKEEAASGAERRSFTYLWK